MKRKHYCNPLNLEYRYQFYRRLQEGREREPYRVYREAADPSLIRFKGTYYLFPSMTAGFFAGEDLHDWSFYSYKGDIPVYDYAPDVRAVGDYLYFSASHMGEICHFYRTRDPRTEAFEKIEGTFEFWDPNLFVDDDGRVYFYWGCSNQEPIYGVELDPKTMIPLTEKQIMFDSASDHRGYERSGNDHIPPKSEEQIGAEVEAMLANIRKQAELEGRDLGMSDLEAREMLRGYFGNRPYIEGAWMTKYGDRYYLQYAIAGTEYNVYGDGVYVSDRPLGPFVPAKNNPYSYKPSGFITGAGHGSTLEDRDGGWWHTASMRISHNESFERRLGLWKAGFDSEGELYCDQRFGDWPIAMDAKAFDKPDWMLLSYGKKAAVSSGTGKEYVTDENIRTFWKAEKNEPGEWVCVDLEKIFEVSAIQINFADDGLLSELPDILQTYRTMYEERYIDTVKQKTRWLLEGSADGENYFVIADKREAETDYAHDFLELDGAIRLRYVRLTVQELPYRQVPAVSGIRVFGRGEGESPAAVTNPQVKYDGSMDMEISWKPDTYAVGAVVLWGHAADRLYHSRIVYGENRVHVGALVSGQSVFVRVDAFNENGITEGSVIAVKESYGKGEVR